MRFRDASCSIFIPADAGIEPGFKNFHTMQPIQRREKYSVLEVRAGALSWDPTCPEGSPDLAI